MVSDRLDTNAWAVGDALVLLAAAAPDADDVALDNLVAMLTRRHFVRSTLAVRGGLIGSVRNYCEQHNLGARLSLEAEHLHGEALRLLVTTRPHAHLALTIVAERSGRFTAEVIGRVLPRGFSVRVDGVARDLY